MIFCSDPKAQYLAFKDEIDAAISNVLDSGRYVLGAETELFETEFSDFLNVNHCIGVGNGTDSLELALKACEVGAGDEVITVSHTAVATVAAISNVGAIPVLADVDPASFTMCVNSLRALISEKTRAIIPVHLYGHPAAMDKIVPLAEAAGIPVIEDCAQAHGATLGGKRVGGFGDLASFSFYPTKNLGALGDGGAVVTSNADLARKVRLLREYGWEQRFNSVIAGRNTRLDEIQAAILRVKLRHLDRLNASRKQIAAFYAQELKGLDLQLPTSGADCDHVYHLYVIRTQQRNELMAHMRENDIHPGIHYPFPVHRQQAYAQSGAGLESTEVLCKEVLSLPIYPELGEQANTVIANIRSFYQ